MEFQVSARKWRPQKFSELIGQEHIVRTLHNAIAMDRVAHAYLFSGTRGVGKTTTARLLAKALNCEQGPTPEPCDQCNFCQEIRDGYSVDVLEIDGASNRGINEVRDLIENVQYSTSACRFKVYIIDEVHMLTKEAFNALLKTLEEPPPKVVFIFATTELIKIPETILSRCQCFEFKPLTQQQIIDQLKAICEHDSITIDAHSLEEIAKNGAGSMRDAQSLLDQVIAFCGKEVESGAVESVLGVVGQNALSTFIDCVIQKDAAGLLQQVKEVIEHGKDLGYFCRDLIEYLRNLMLVKVAANAESLLSGQAVHLDTLKKQAGALQPDELQQMFYVLSRAEMEMKRSPSTFSQFPPSVEGQQAPPPGRKPAGARRLWKESRDFDTAGEFAHLCLREVLHLAVGFIDGAGHQVFQNGAVLHVDQFIVDVNVQDFVEAVSGNLYHAAAGRGFDLFFGELFLHFSHFGFHLSRLLEHVAHTFKHNFLF